MTPPDGEGPDRVGRVLEKVLDRLGIRQEIADQEVLHRWDELVGDRIAEVARPRALARGVLFVEVRSSAWLNELNLMKPQLLSRVRADTDSTPVEKIVFTLEERR